MGEAAKKLRKRAEDLTAAYALIKTPPDGMWLSWAEVQALLAELTPEKP